jgi:hypothetical protein
MVCADISFLVNRTYWTGGFSSGTPEKYQWCSSKSAEADLTSLKWKNETPKYIPEGCLRVYLPRNPEVKQTNGSSTTTAAAPGHKNLLKPH